jgi:hypothetical protein
MENDNYKESLVECIKSRLIFVQALDALLSPGTGVFVELSGKALELGFKRVIVHNNIDDNEIVVTIAEERTDLKHGDMVTMINGDIISN